MTINKVAHLFAICLIIFSRFYQTVPKVGASGEIVTVSRGFARNFLLPQRLAKPATREASAAAKAAAAAGEVQKSGAGAGVDDELTQAHEALSRLTSGPLVREWSCKLICMSALVTGKLTPPGSRASADNATSSKQEDAENPAHFRVRNMQISAFPFPTAHPFLCPHSLPGIPHVAAPALQIFSGASLCLPMCRLRSRSTFPCRSSRCALPGTHLWPSAAPLGSPPHWAVALFASPSHTPAPDMHHN